MPTTASPVCLTLPASPGYAVPVRWFAADPAQAAILLMPALGVAARFYDPLAASLQAAGVPVLVMEQRGHGDSGLRPSRQVDFGYREALNEDIPAMIAFLRQQDSQRPIVLMGHSLGGHYAAITAGRLPADIAGVIVAACGSAWIGGFSGRIRRQLQVLTRLIPVLTATLGYYPGDKVGFGGREARRLMHDWLQLAKHNRYAAAGLDEDLETGIRCYAGPVLSLRMKDDDFAPEAAMAAVTDRFTSAQLTQQVLDANALGDKADHFRWVRSPQAVTAEVVSWLTRQF